MGRVLRLPCTIGYHRETHGSPNVGPSPLKQPLSCCRAVSEVRFVRPLWIGTGCPALSFLLPVGKTGVARQSLGAEVL